MARRQASNVHLLNLLSEKWTWMDKPTCEAGEIAKSRAGIIL